MDGGSRIELDGARTALLLLDFQNYGLHPEGYWAKQGDPGWPSGAYPAVENTARVLEAARSTGVLVVHVGAAWRPGSPEMSMNIPVFARGPIGRSREPGARSSMRRSPPPPGRSSSTSGA